MNISVLRYFLHIFLLLAHFHPVLPQRICFYRSNSIWISEIDGRNQRFLVEGKNPEISPNGKKIVYNYQVQTQDVQWDTQIGVYSISSGFKYIFHQIPGSFNTQPHWSSSGKFIAFNHFTGQKQEIAVVDSLGDKFKIITENIITKGQPEFAFWKGDSIIVIYDNSNLHELSLKGKLLAQISISELIEFYNNNLISFSKLNIDQQLLFTHLYETIDSSGEPTDVVFVYDTRISKTQPITPSNLHAQYPLWHSNGKDVLFQGTDQSTNKTNIYKISDTGKNLLLLIENGQYPSCSKNAF